MLGDTENLSSDAVGAPPQILAPQPTPPLAPREIWKLRDLLLFLAFIPFSLLVSALGVLLGYVVLRPFTSWHVRVDLVQADTIFLLIQQCIFYVFILGFLFLLARLQHRQPLWRSLGWKKPTARQVAVYLAGGTALALVTSLALLLVPDSQDFPLEKLFNSRTASFAIGAFAISMAPVVEELVFRGLLFAIFERAVGLRFAVVATAVLFAGLHIPEYWHAWNHMFMILVVGMVFSLARGATGSLTPSIILHIGYNSLIMASLFFSTQHFRSFHTFFIGRCG
ncbi:MAG: lysostaphin resistance A-like protein [Terriglobia bacterium]